MLTCFFVFFTCLGNSAAMHMFPMLNADTDYHTDAVSLILSMHFQLNAESRGFGFRVEEFVNSES